MKTDFAPGTSEQDVFTVTTRAGRARLFQKRLDEITAQLKSAGRPSTLADAVHELRASSDPNDIELLAAMGEKPSAFRSEHLKNEKFVRDLHRAARENASAQTPSAEVKDAAKAALKANNEQAAAVNAKIGELVREGRSVPQQLYVDSEKCRSDELLLSVILHGPIGYVNRRNVAARNGELNKGTFTARSRSGLLTKTTSIREMTERALAFNARVTDLMQEGFDFDAAIRQMRANSTDAALIESMQRSICYLKNVYGFYA